MSPKSNILIPVLSVGLLVIVGSGFFVGRNGPPAAQPMKEVPLPKATGADEDTPAETLGTVVASNRALREEVKVIVAENTKLQQQLRDFMQSGGGARASAAAAMGQPAPLDTSARKSPADVLADAWGNAGHTIGHLGGGTAPNGAGTSDALADDLEPGAGSGYTVLAPMGYVSKASTDRGTVTTSYVRSRSPATAQAGAPGEGAATRAAQQAKAAEPYFTLPENATLAGVTAMTSLIGRVPVNGRVTDPMQFKAMVGRNNLAANGWELPDDLAGMVVTGVAIGDMALSCIEGKVRSMTFVFNDGAIQTVSARRQSGSASSGTGSDLGFISDLHGNPCIQGQFVTNAPAYLTDIIGAKGLGVAAEALAQAQTTTMNRGDSMTSSITGSAGSFALGRMGSAATEELVRWLTERLKSSFDAVVAPAGQQLVVHLDREVQLDKPANPRKIVHRTQSLNVLSGARYGLE